MAEPVCIVPAGDWTGEGCVWDADEQALYWTDINRFLVHRLDPSTRGVKSWFFSEPVVVAALTERPDTLILALASKVILWQPANDARGDLSAPEPRSPQSRLNDGGVDPAGFFWVGSMQNNVAPDGSDIPITKDNLGSIYRISSAGHPRTFKENIGISNTFCWSPDHKLFYTADTLRNQITVWDYDQLHGGIANERPFFFDFERGKPDGSAVDVSGHIWSARYGGGCVVRLTPEGKVDRVVDLPVDNITNCTFGGADLKTLFITTAKGGSGKGERLAGSLYALAVDIPGVPANRFRFSGNN